VGSRKAWTKRKCPFENPDRERKNRRIDIRYDDLEDPWKYNKGFDVSSIVSVPFLRLPSKLVLDNTALHMDTPVRLKDAFHTSGHRGTTDCALPPDEWRSDVHDFMLWKICVARVWLACATVTTLLQCAASIWAARRSTSK